MLWVGVFIGLSIAAACGTTLWLTRSPAQVASAKGPLAKNISGLPIEWRFDKPTTLFWYSRKAGETIRIEAIVIHATNKSEFALRNVKASIVADMKIDPLVMRVNPHGSILKPDESATIIPQGSTFDLTIGLELGGVTAEQFLSEYGGLRFDFSYDDHNGGQRFMEQFSISYIEDQIAFIQGRTLGQSRLPQAVNSVKYPPQRDTNINQNITSNNQAGGITAHTVNHGQDGISSK